MGLAIDTVFTVGGVSIRLAKRVKHVAISKNTATDHVLVTGVDDRKIRVTSYTLVAAGSVNVTFKRDSTAMTGAMPFAANGGASASGHPEAPVLECGAGEDLVLTLSAAVQVSGHLSYTIED